MGYHPPMSQMESNRPGAGIESIDPFSFGLPEDQAAALGRIFDPEISHEEREKEQSAFAFWLMVHGEESDRIIVELVYAVQRVIQRREGRTCVEGRPWEQRTRQWLCRTARALGWSNPIYYGASERPVFIDEDRTLSGKIGGGYGSSLYEFHSEVPVDGDGVRKDRIFLEDEGHLVSLPEYYRRRKIMPWCTRCEGVVMRQEDETPLHPRLAEEVFDAFLEVMSGVDSPEEPEFQRVRRTLLFEQKLLRQPTIWPLLSADQRTEIIDGDFRGGVRPESHQHFTCQAHVCARREPLWRALWAVAQTHVEQNDGTVPKWLLHQAALAPAYDAFHVLRCARSIGYPQAMRKRPGSPGFDPEARQQAIDGQLWMWCDEGWMSTGFDVRLGRGESVDTALGGSQVSKRKR